MEFKHDFGNNTNLEQQRRHHNAYLDELRRKIMANFALLNSALTQLETDTAAYIAAVPASSSSDQPAIDTATARVTALDATIQAATKALGGTTA